MDPEKLAIREVIENWALWRDAGDWDRFATVWHDDGWMTATWFQGPASEFIRVSREGFEKGVSILHFLGGFTCDITGTRAVSQTKMTINQRATVDDVLVDVVCTGGSTISLKSGERYGLGDRPAPADLREGPDGSGRSRRVTDSGSRAACTVSRRLSAPRLPAVEDRVRREGQPARAARRRLCRSCTRKDVPGSRDPRRQAKPDRNDRDTPAHSAPSTSPPSASAA